MTPPNTGSDASRLYHAVLAHLEGCLWNDSRNAQTLAWMVTGLLQSATVNLPSWTSFVSSKAQFSQSTERRFTRWLQNQHVHPTTLYNTLIIKALRSWGTGRLVLALDTSMLFEQFCLIRIAVLYRGRAVPLCWSLIEHRSAQVSLEQLRPLLAQAKGLLDLLGLKDVLMLADRGFVDVSLMRCLRGYGWHYRIRLKGHLTLFSALGVRIGKVKDITLSQGTAKFYHHVYLSKAQFGPVHLACAHRNGAKESWLVVSSEKTDLSTFEEYGLRFGIEQGFLDDKSGGFGLEDSELRNAGMLDRLMLVLAVGALLLVSEGTVAVEAGARRSVDSHWKRGLSYFKIGWRMVKRALSRVLPFFTKLCLVGGADPDPSRPPSPKRRRSSLADAITTVWTLAFRPA